GSAFYQVAKALSPLSGPVLDVLGALARGIASIASTLPWLVQGAGGHGAVENLRAQARGGYAKGGPVVAKGGVPGFALGGAV
ncbi:hypothetical protein KBZ21_41580, partial [Streptomyces sp. A73]|nr:hypothetical protein [Streptomyces sp. A73]